jgi:predicted nucleotidyltransferase
MSDYTQDVKKHLNMTGKEIVDILQKEKSYLQVNFGLLSIGLFGSYGKGTERPDSDIDVLVELTEPRFDFLAGLQIYLEGRLGKPVEVIRKRKGLSERFLRRIEESIHYV